MEKGVVKKKGGTVRDFIESRMPDLQKMLPDHIKPERFLRIILNEFRRNPKLLECSSASLLGALMQCAQTGLEPGPLQECALIPYKNEVQFQIMYRGYIKLLRNTGEMSTINAEVVYENDIFDFEQGLNARLYHKPTLDKRGAKIAVYAIVKFKDGSYVFRVLTPADVEKVKKASKAKFEPGKPWHDWDEEMWRKTGIKKIVKVVPLDTETARKVAQDETIKHIDPDEIDKAKEIDILSAPDEMKWNGDEEQKTTTPTRKSDKKKDDKPSLKLNGQTKEEMEEAQRLELERENGE
jgi:recombination protein RecT